MGAASSSGGRVWGFIKERKVWILAPFVLFAVELALRARDEFVADNPESGRHPIVAASIGPYGAAQHDGSEYTGAYDVSDEDLGAFHMGVAHAS